jgi:hypothetical protein
LKPLNHLFGDKLLFFAPVQAQYGRLVTRAEDQTT